MDEMVKVIVAYSPNKTEVGTVKEISLDEFRVLSREGRVRRYNEEVDGPARNAPADDTQPAQPAAVQARPAAEPDKPRKDTTAAAHADTTTKAP